jgi:multidrug efflux pump subunit AcrB
VFPAETEKPVISLSQRSWAVISVVIAGDYSEDEIRLYAERVRDDLLRTEGITKVSLGSVRKYEIANTKSRSRPRPIGCGNSI